LIALVTSITTSGVSFLSLLTSGVRVMNFFGVSSFFLLLFTRKGTAEGDSHRRDNDHKHPRVRLVQLKVNKERRHHNKQRTCRTDRQKSQNSEKDLRSEVPAADRKYASSTIGSTDSEENQGQ
jgi:hypothetical protein